MYIINSNQYAKEFVAYLLVPTAIGSIAFFSVSQLRIPLKKPLIPIDIMYTRNNKSTWMDLMMKKGVT